MTRMVPITDLLGPKIGSRIGLAESNGEEA
jgi:hypothetical protein